jgi:hypothetical protein
MCKAGTMGHVQPNAGRGIMKKIAAKRAENATQASSLPNAEEYGA